PVTGSDADRDAATRFDGFRNRWFLDAVQRGVYPADMLEVYRDVLPEIADGDLETISVATDFLGLNYYRRTRVSAGANGASPVAVRTRGAEHPDMGWEASPDGLHPLLRRVHGEYGPARIYVTENGASYTDVRRHDGTVRDPERIGYLDRHVAAVGRALVDGIPVHGYFVWSLLDNFESAHGYSRPFRCSLVLSL